MAIAKRGPIQYFVGCVVAIGSAGGVVLSCPFGAGPTSSIAVRAAENMQHDSGEKRGIATASIFSGRIHICSGAKGWVLNQHE